jgi:hypothetical protein
MRWSDVELVEEEIPIRQGDVLSRVHGDANSAYLVVVSADCDLAQEKLSDAGVACVPLIQLREYLLLHYGKALARRQLDKRCIELSAWVNKRWSAVDGNHQPLSHDRAISWLSKATVDEISEALALGDDEKARKYLSGEMTCIKTAARLLDTDGSCIDALAALQRSKGDRAELIRSQLGKLDSYQLPLDIFFLTEVPGDSNFGFIAQLRHLAFLPLASVFTSITRAREHDAAFLRIGRMAPTLKHGLAQQLGALFSRIGYPLEYERNREAAFNVVIDELAMRMGHEDA